MASDPNKLSQFWQELKRRNVVRVITVYAGAAFVIIELINNISEPLHLPEWTPTLVIVLLAIGFPIVIIFSWIYDIHPKEGMVKTEPAEMIKAEDIPKSSNSWKIASYISFVVIMGLVVLNIIPRAGKKEILDKSIAVLPFMNDSPEETEMFFINGTMESILDNLCKIEDIRVVSRTSVEQYRNNPKPIPTVGKEMNVSYIVAGSGLKHGNNIRLTIKLIDASNDKNLWSNTFNRNASEIFELQSEIAQMVAKEIEAVITPEEKKLIEEVPTTSLKSNDLYLRGREEYVRFLLDIYDEEALLLSRDYYFQALEYDSTFAKAYAGLAMTYFSELVRFGNNQRIYFEGYLERDAFEPVRRWANRALLFDNQLSDAYTIRGKYYHQTGQRERAEQDFIMAISLNPNQWDAFQGIGDLYAEYDYVKALEYYNKASSGLRGSELSLIVDRLMFVYMMTGLVEEAESLLSEYLKLNIDSVTYYIKLAWIEIGKQNTEEQNVYFEKAYAYDTLNPFAVYYMSGIQLSQGNYEKALAYYEESLNLFRKAKIIPYNLLHRIGYVYAQAGYADEADYYLNKQEEYCKAIIDLNRPEAQTSIAYWDLACVYALRGWKDETLETLGNIINGPSKPMITMSLLKTETFFDRFRNDPDFEQILLEANILYRTEQVRIKQWLEENNLL